MDKKVLRIAFFWIINQQVSLTVHKGIELSVTNKKKLYFSEINVDLLDSLNFKLNINVQLLTCPPQYYSIFNMRLKISKID